MEGMNTIATTKIWNIKVRLDHVIDYIIDLEKTKNSSYNEDFFCLHDNDTDNLKIEKACFVSAINCSVDTAYNEMMITKRAYDKTGGILGFHMYQSFAEKEVTPELAHRIGVQLATEMWGERFEVVVSTHQNTKHIHNHFVINSVSFKDGKKYYDNHTNYARLKKLSDDLCAEYGLSIITEKKTKSGLFYNNFYNNYVNNSDYYKMVKEDIDLAILNAYSYNNFLDVLKSMGDKIVIKNNILSVVKEPYKLRIRVTRTFGKNYNKKNIIRRIEKSYVQKYKDNLLTIFFKEKKYKNGLFSLFKSYCNLLEQFYKNPKSYDYSIRKDIRKLDFIIKQTDFLSSNNIITSKDLFNVRSAMEKQLDNLLDQLDKINYKIKKTSVEYDLNQLYLEKEHLKKKLKNIRYKLKMIDEIEKRKPIIKTNINTLENGYRKEVDKDELRRGS